MGRMAGVRQQRAGNEAGGFRLWHAVAASVLLHLLLAPLFLLFSLARAVPVEEPDETVLQFSFAAPDEENRQDDAASLPALAPLPQKPELPPQIEPEGAPEVPSPEVVPLPEQIPPPPATATEPPQEAPDRAADPEISTELPAGRGDFTRRADAATPRGSFDVSQALQDYGEALSRYREANPPEQRQGRDQPSNVFVPDPQEFPGSGFGFGNLQFESTDYHWSDYARQVLLEIWKAWHRRLHQTVDEFERFAFQNDRWYLNDQCQVRFVIQRNGSVADILLEYTSGWPALDASATTAMEEVVLPPLPADFPRETEVVHIRFIAIGEVRGMRPTLNYLKRMGRF